MRRIVISILTLVIFTASFSFADDLGYVKPANKFQTEILKQLFDHAYSRNGNQFLVLADDNTQATLSKAGIEFDMLIENADISSLHLIRPSGKPILNSIDLSSLTRTYDLGHGTKLGSVSRIAVSTIEDDPGFTVTPLEDLSVRFFYIPETVAANFSAIDDFPTDSLADLVSYDSVYAYNTRLEAFQTRYIYSDSIVAALDWMVSKFVDWGYTDITTPLFYYNSYPLSNLMVVKQGYAEPDKVIVIGGHYDSIVYNQSPGAMTYAPGSDDDGSGTTLTMEMARILKDVPTRKTIIFLPFSAEEVGLVGSRAAAQSFAANNTLVEVMLNFDMVGFDEDSYYNLDLSSGPVTGYRDLMASTASRLTILQPVIQGMGSSSDHYSFYEQGFNIVDCIEGDFNYTGWHTNLDLTSRMNFEYLTEVARMTAATLGIVANAAYPTEISDIIDMGDGQSVTVGWDDCFEDYTYQVIYGTVSGVYTDTVDVLPGECSVNISGLSEGTTYYFSISGTVVDGYPAIYTVEESGASFIIPRSPNELRSNPDSLAVLLDWQSNKEADFSHYRIYRDAGSGFEMLDDNVYDTTYLDNTVEKYTEYNYVITAVDLDGYESANSNQVNGIAATFDKGVLLVDEVSTEDPMPDQSEQLSFFASIMGSVSYDLEEIVPNGDPVDRFTIGQYKSILWIDDDPTSKEIDESNDSLLWFDSFSTNLFVCGMQTLSYWSPSYVPTDHFLTTEFGVDSFKVNNGFDFMGAEGLNGFPNIEIDPANAFGDLPFVTRLYLNENATPIYNFNSRSDNPTYEGYPCAAMVETEKGKRILLGFPLYYLTETSAKALMTKVLSEFGEDVSYISGDVNGSGELDISDLLYLVDYMFIIGSPTPTNLNAADVDGSCQIDISDLLYLVDYMFDSPAGPAPLPGCVM